MCCTICPLPRTTRTKLLTLKIPGFDRQPNRCRVRRRREPLPCVRRDMFGHSGPTALVTAPVMADSQEEARAALALLETCPVLGKAAIREVNIVTELDGLLQGAEDMLYPQGAHYAADNMWTSASADALLPGMRNFLQGAHAIRARHRTIDG